MQLELNEDEIEQLKFLVNKKIEQLKWVIKNKDPRDKEGLEKRIEIYEGIITKIEG